MARPSNLVPALAVGRKDVVPALRKCLVKCLFFQGVGTLMKPGQRALRLR